MDLREAEDTKKRWQEYTEELYKKDLHNPDNHEDVITSTHLELDILECEVRCIETTDLGLELPLLSRFSRVRLCATP